jgi:hypothetical protein
MHIRATNEYKRTNQKCESGAVHEEKTVDVVTLGWPGPCRTVEVLNPSCLMTAVQLSVQVCGNQSCWKFTDEVGLLKGLRKRGRKHVAVFTGITTTIGANSDDGSICVLPIRALDVSCSTFPID